GLPPVIVSARGETVTRLAIGATTLSGGQYAFTVVEYDITGDAPVEMARTRSDYTSLPGAGGFGISLSDCVLYPSPSGRKIAFFMGFGDPNPVALALYDVTARSFGALCIDMLGTYQSATQIAWLDEQRLAIADKVGDAKGVRLYAASGQS